MAAIERPINDAMGPLISNFPIWVAETQGVSTSGPAGRAGGRRP